MIDYIIIAIAISILFAVFNGLIINWKQQPNAILAARISKTWHLIGFMIRVGLFIQLALILNVWGIILGVLLLWPGYNIIINLVMKQKWFYVGTTAWTDKIIRKVFNKVKFDK